MSIGVLTLQFHLPGCSSLKEKRGRLKPILSRLHREYNVAVAEMDLQDVWQSAVISCVTISSAADQNQRLLQQVIDFTEHNYPDVELVDHTIELL